MRRQFGAFALSIALTLAAGAGVSAADAAATFSKEEAAVAKKLEDAYGVRVLRIRSGDVDGTAVYIVTVMNPAGDFNAAFQVTTLAVGKSSGALISQYRQTPTGQRRSGAASRNPSGDISGTAMRRRTERRLRPR
jgi:hypothetical protein